MNRRLSTRTAVLASAVLGLTFGLTASSGATITTHLTASTHGTAPTHGTAAARALAAAAPAYVVYDCAFKGQVKPATETLTCADAGMVLESLRWASWTPRFASASGTLTENDCKPNCADGHFHNYPVVVVAWGSGSVVGHPAQRRYTQFTLIYTAQRPPYYEMVNGKVVTTYPATQTLPAI